MKSKTGCPLRRPANVSQIRVTVDLSDLLSDVDTYSKFLHANQDLTSVRFIAGFNQAVKRRLIEVEQITADGTNDSVLVFRLSNRVKKYMSAAIAGDFDFLKQE